jgi:hypothetical protein
MGWLSIIALPCLLYSMNLNVLHLAIPQLTADLKPSGTQLLWIVDIYGFLLAGFLMIFRSWCGLLRKVHESAAVRCLGMNQHACAADSSAENALTMSVCTAPCADPCSPGSSFAGFSSDYHPVYQVQSVRRSLRAHCALNPNRSRERNEGERNSARQWTDDRGVVRRLRKHALVKRDLCKAFTLED